MGHEFPHRRAPAPVGLAELNFEVVDTANGVAIPPRRGSDEFNPVEAPNESGESDGRFHSGE